MLSGSMAIASHWKIVSLSKEVRSLMPSGIVVNEVHQDKFRLRRLYSLLRSGKAVSMLQVLMFMLWSGKILPSGTSGNSVRNSALAMAKLCREAILPMPLGSAAMAKHRSRLSFSRLERQLAPSGTATRLDAPSSIKVCNLWCQRTTHIQL